MAVKKPAVDGRTLGGFISPIEIGLLPFRLSRLVV